MKSQILGLIGDIHGVDQSSRDKVEAKTNNKKLNNKEKKNEKTSWTSCCWS